MVVSKVYDRDLVVRGYNTINTINNINIINTIKYTINNINNSVLVIRREDNPRFGDL